MDKEAEVRIALLRAQYRHAIALVHLHYTKELRELHTNLGFRVPEYDNSVSLYERSVADYQTSVTHRMYELKEILDERKEEYEEP